MFQGRVQFVDHMVVPRPVTNQVGVVDSPKVSSDVPVPALAGEPGTAFATGDRHPLLAGLR